MKAKAVGATLVTSLLLTALFIARPLPARWFEAVEHREVLDSQGDLLASTHIPGRGRATWVELSEVSPAVIDALLASEDSRFRSHFGIDPWGVLRSARANLRAGRVVQGASTLTQQTARLLAGRRPGWMGKLNEAQQAVRLDYHLSKEEILTWYLNRAYFGRGSTGIYQASMSTFAKAPHTLSLSEAATLVAVLPAPERIHPRIDQKRAREARDRVLDRMAATHRATEGAVRRAKAQPLQLASPEANFAAPHLVTRLLATTQNTHIQTFVDSPLQHNIERLITDTLGRLNADVDHAAVLVASVPSGEVLAYVGSADWSGPDGQNDGVIANRSPGSTLKPFTYSLAMQRGWTPATVLPDLKHSWQTSHGAWIPTNYSGTYHGPVRLRTALASSWNVPAVVALEHVGATSLYSFLINNHLPLSHSPSYYGLGLTLGDAEANLEQLVSLYGMLANGGQAFELRFSEANKPLSSPKQILRPQTAYWITSILADRDARRPAFSSGGPLNRHHNVSVKTGTSTDYRDNWTVGYTDQWVVGVWVGNFDNRSMGNVSGVTGAAPLWADVMSLLLKDSPVNLPQPPKELVETKLCALSGLVATEHCDANVLEHLPTQDTPKACDWHQPCGTVWPAQYRGWAKQNQLSSCEDSSSQQHPTALEISKPSDHAQLYLDSRLPLSGQNIHLKVATNLTDRVHWRANGQWVGWSDPQGAFRWEPKKSGDYTLVAVINDHQSKPIQINVSGIEP